MVTPLYISSLNPNFALFAVHLNVALQVQLSSDTMGQQFRPPQHAQ